MWVLKGTEMKRFFLVILGVVVLVVVGLVLISLMWLKMDQYVASDEALGMMNNPSDGTSQVVVNDEYIFFDASVSADEALIFYGGAKVEPQAYAYLGYFLNQEGIDVYLPFFPFNMAMFDMNAAQGIMVANPEISN
jgi:hypothetical protein